LETAGQVEELFMFWSRLYWLGIWDWWCTHHLSMADNSRRHNAFDEWNHSRKKGTERELVLGKPPNDDGEQNQDGRQDTAANYSKKAHDDEKKRQKSCDSKAGECASNVGDNASNSRVWYMVVWFGVFLDGSVKH
jgi:hypothetical protein